MSTIGETYYSLSSGRSHEHNQILTPYSAVSSFNLPQSCDSTLITPVSLTQNPSLNTTSIPAPDMEIKLSPSSISPPYDLFNMDDDFLESKYNPPMKYKNPPGTLHISTTDASFPPSPLVPSTPYWGAYGVSATPVSSRSESSPSMNPSPVRQTLNSTGGQSNDAQQQHHHQQSAPVQNYRNRASVPLLIAPRVPSPSSRAQMNYRQNSLQSISTVSSIATPTAFPEPRTSMPIRRRRKSPKHSRDGDILLSGDMTYDEQILMRLTEVDRLPWKEVMVKFRELTGKNMKVPALQMRKKRLIERLRVWTPADEKALTQAMQTHHQDKLRWDEIAQAMLKYGCLEKWSKEAIQKKWYEMHPVHEDLMDEYERAAEDRERMQFNVEEEIIGMGRWEGGGLEGMSPRTAARLSISATTAASVPSVASSVSLSDMQQRGSREASDASDNCHLLLQRQIMFEHQQHQQQQQQHQQNQHQQNQHQHQHQHQSQHQRSWNNRGS